MSPRIVFMGSPEFAVPALERLAAEFNVIGVVTQPDRPSGRGRKLSQPPVKLIASKLNLPIIQPVRLSSTEALEQLQSWKPDLIVVAAFGQILKPDVLDLPPFGCINLHASLLPRWRGAAPIQAAILTGDSSTGVTIMKMDAGIDTGPILSQVSIEILAEDTASSLSDRLAHTGAELLIDTLSRYIIGDIQPDPQANSGATYAPMLKKTDGKLDIAENAQELSRKIRAYHPWPGTYYEWKGGTLIIHQAHVVLKGPENLRMPAQKPLLETTFNGLPALQTLDGLLALDVVQPAGKKIMPGAAFLLGAKGWGNTPETKARP